MCTAASKPRLSQPDLAPMADPIDIIGRRENEIYADGTISVKKRAPGPRLGLFLRRWGDQSHKATTQGCTATPAIKARSKRHISRISNGASLHTSKPTA